MCRPEINAAVDKTIRRDLSSERKPELSETLKNDKTNLFRCNSLQIKLVQRLFIARLCRVRSL
jgi:hypothetical protein